MRIRARDEEQLLLGFELMVEDLQQRHELMVEEVQQRHQAELRPVVEALNKERAVISQLKEKLSNVSVQAEMYNADTFEKYCALARQHLSDQHNQHQKAMALLRAKMETEVAKVNKFEKLSAASVGDIVEVPRRGYPEVWLRL